MPRPTFRIACCLCRKAIAQAKDIYGLDAEWQRRYPQMVGTLACPECAHGRYWRCRTPDGAYVPGHLPAADTLRLDRCYDCWDHIEGFGTQVAMVVQYPESGLRQGAEAYLRWAVRRPGMDSELVARLQAALDQPETEHGADRSDQAPTTTAVTSGQPAGREGCNACDPRPLGPYHQPYDHVLWEQVLPRNLTTDDCVRQCGYAVGFAGSIQQIWVFFADLEPALVFGRAGRMSSDIRSYSAYHAVHEVKFDEQFNRDVRTLYLQHGSLDRQPDEQEAFQRWLAGTIPASSHFQPPRVTGGTPER